MFALRAQISAYADTHKATHKMLITLLINNAKKMYIVLKKYVSLHHKKNEKYGNKRKKIISSIKTHSKA